MVLSPPTHVTVTAAMVIDMATDMATDMVATGIMAVDIPTDTVVKNNYVAIFKQIQSSTNRNL